MADDKTLDVVYLDVEIRKNGIENGLKQIGIEGKKSLHITQLAADDLNKAIKEAGDQVNITRRLFQAGAKDANTFETEMRQLDSAIKHLIETQELDTKQLLKLSGAARTAQASLDVYEGKITKLGLAHNVAIANSGKFNTQILNMVPGVSTLSGQLGIMSSAGLSAGAVLGGGLAIGAGLAVSALNKAARAAAEVADELDKNSGRVGVAVEEYQRLVYWADQNGISQDQLRQGLGDLNTRVGQAVAGNKTYAKSFEQLGVSLKDSNGNTRATDEILRDLVDRLSQTENAAERTALAGAAFGEEFSRIVQPALMNGVEGFDELRQKADDLGLVLDEQTVSVLVNYKDRMAEVDTAFRNAGIGITVAFLPILESLAKYTLETVVPAMQTLAGWIERIGQIGSNFLASGLGRSTAEGIQRDAENFKLINDEIATLNENLAFHQAQLEKNAGAGRFGGVLGLTDENILVSINDINNRLAKLADERAEIGERLRTFQFGTGSNNSPFVTTPPINVPSPTGGGSTGGGSSTSSSTPKTPIAVALTEEERAAKLALDKLQNTIVGYDEERKKLETLFASGVINQEQIDRSYLKLVENTIDKLASSFASGTSTTFATQLYNDLVGVLPLLREINKEKNKLTDAGVTSADRALAAAAPGNPFNQTSAILPLKTRKQITEEMLAALDEGQLAFAEYLRDTVKVGIDSHGFTSAKLHLTDALNQADLMLGEYIRDSANIGIIGDGFSSVPLNRPESPFFASGLSGQDILAGEYLRDINGIGLFGQDFKPLIQEKLKTTTEVMLEGLNQTALDGAEYVRDTLHIGLDSADFSPAAYELVSGLDQVALDGAEYIRDSLKIGIIGGGFRSVPLNRSIPTFADPVTQNILNGGLQDFAKFDPDSIRQLVGLGVLNLGPDGATDETIQNFKDTILGSSDDFASTIVDSAGQVASVFTQIATGQATPGSALAGLGGAAAGIVGTFNPLAGQIVGVASGILGGIFDAFGNNEAQRERERLASQNRSLPSITFSNYITQNNQYTGTPLDEPVRQQYTSNAAELGETMFNYVLPELAKLKAKVN